MTTAVMAQSMISDSARRADFRFGRRIAIVLPNLAAIGAQRYVIGLMKRLEQSGFECSLLLQAPVGEFLDEIRAWQTFSHRVLSPVPFARTLESAVRLTRMLRGHRYDQVFSVTPFLNRMICAMKGLKLIEARVVIEEHGYPPLYLTREDGMSRAEVGFYTRSFGLYRHADAIRVISGGIRDFYAQHGLTANVHFFPNLIDLSRVERLANESPAAVLPKSHRNVIVFGRLTAQKNLSFLIEGLSRPSFPRDMHLWIIGDGPQRSALEDLSARLGVREHVTFMGYLENPYPVIRQGDALALTSVWEGSPQVLVEAMALGVPIVARDCPTGPSDILGTRSERGALVPYSASPEEFGAALRASLNDASSEVRAGAAKSFVSGEYDLDSRMSEQISLFFT